MGFPPVNGVLRPSSPVGDEVYDDLVALARWAADEGAPSDAELTGEAAGLLHREARLLDQRQLDRWLDLWAADGVLWVPVATDADPRRALSIELADVTHLRERALRLRSAPPADVPTARTLRTVSNVEAWSHGSGRRVRSALVLWVRRGDEERAFPAVQAHELADGGGGWRIRRKVLALLASTTALPSALSGVVL